MQLMLSCDAPNLSALFNEWFGHQLYSLLLPIMKPFVVLCVRLTKMEEMSMPSKQVVIFNGKFSTYVLWIEALSSDFFL